MNNLFSEQLTSQEVAYLTAYDNVQASLEHVRAYPELYSTKQVLDLTTIASKFNMAKVIDLQNRLNWYGK